MAYLGNNKMLFMVDYVVMKAASICRTNTQPASAGYVIFFCNDQYLHNPLVPPFEKKIFFEFTLFKSYLNYPDKVSKNM